MKNLITQIVTFPERLSNNKAGLVESLVFTGGFMVLLAIATIIIHK